MPLYDAIIVGAGATGMMAAIFGAKRGLRMLLIEATEEIGGTLHISSARMSAAGTKLQRQFGIEDSADAFYDDVMRICRNTADPVLLRLAVDHAAETFDWLMDNGFSLALPEPVTHFGIHEAYQIPRYSWGTELGKTTLKVLLPHFNAAIASGHLKVMLRHEAIGILQDDTGRCIGVEAQGPDQAVKRFEAGSVVVATGGFAANDALHRQYHGVALHSAGAWRGAQGKGIALCLGAGGYMRGMEHYHANFGAVLESYDYPSFTIAKASAFPEVRPPWEIYLDSSGKRFLKEEHPSVDERERALIALPDQRYWTVFDEAILSQAPALLDGWTREQMRGALGKHEMFIKADSLEDLAAQTGMDLANLQQAITAYNERPTEGPFARKHAPLPIAQAPFYAVRHHATIITSTPGIAVNGNLEVIDRNGQAIAGLYAAGEVIGAVATMGDAAANGMLITPALAFGRLLGEKILPRL